MTFLKSAPYALARQEAVSILIGTMASTKAGGTAKNLRDSNPKYLGVKRGSGQNVRIGEVIVRQRGTKIMAGKNVGIGKDHTLFALKAGIVTFHSKRKINFDGRGVRRSIANIA